MSHLWTCLLLCCSVMTLAQPQMESAPHQDTDIMLAAVARDTSMLVGGLGPSKWTGRGTVEVEPLARLTQSGDWISLPCNSRHILASCTRFAREYLNKPHVYTVISADGQGATIHSAPTTLSECYTYNGPGTYSGAAITRSAIAASSSEFFADSLPPQPVNEGDAKSIRKVLALSIPGKLDSVKRMRFLSVHLEGQQFYVVQRASAEIDYEKEQETLDRVFAIGAIDRGHFHILQWKKNTVDEDEAVLGTIQLKSGRGFLITVVNDPEGQWFRVYGIEGGRLALVFSGGGASC